MFQWYDGKCSKSATVGCIQYQLVGYERAAARSCINCLTDNTMIIHIQQDEHDQLTLSFTYRHIIAASIENRVLSESWHSKHSFARSVDSRLRPQVLGLSWGYGPITGSLNKCDQCSEYEWGMDCVTICVSRYAQSLTYLTQEVRQSLRWLTSLTAINWLDLRLN